MKNILTMLVLLIAACMNNPYATLRNYKRDDLFCWYRGDSGKWKIVGKQNMCPKNASYGHVQP